MSPERTLDSKWQVRDLLISYPKLRRTVFASLQMKFPVPANKFPVPRNIFPVNLSRELLEKWLQRSGFLLRNRSREPQKCKIPCKIPC